MPKVLVYCGKAALERELESGLAGVECSLEICRESGVFMEKAVEEKPPVLVICFGSRDKWGEAGIAALKKTCSDSKIIFATERPGGDDGKIVQQGVFFYGGNSSAEDILEAVTAAVRIVGR